VEEKEIVINPKAPDDHWVSPSGSDTWCTVGQLKSLIAEVLRLSNEVVRLKKIEVAARAIADNAEEVEHDDMAGFAASLEYLSDLNGILDDAEVEQLVAEGHTEHCAGRHVWGDGQCECQKKGIIPGAVSRMIVEPV
jgi:hypothetical protein